MYDWDDDDLFGHDGRHKPPFVYLPAKFSGSSQNIRRKWQLEKELESLEELLDCPKAIGGDYMFMSTALRYVLFTWSVGRIEVDVLPTHFLLLPEETYREAIYARLNNAGYYYQIVGDLKFIKIKRHEKEN